MTEILTVVSPKLVAFYISQSATQEASEHDDPTKEILSDSSRDNTATVISNKTQIEVQQGKEDSSSLQNGVEKQQENATGNPTVSQKTADNTDQTKRKSTFGGLKKGFLL